MLAALPLVRIWGGPGITSALIVGSIIPDWPLYISIGPAYETTHSFPGIVTASLPLGLGMLLLFLLVMKRPLVELLPMGVRRRNSFHVDRSFTPEFRSLLALSVAICVGALSHIVWDAFTHGRGWGVAAFPEMKHIWITVAGVKFPGYMALQHGSSIVGLPLLVLLFALWYRSSTAGPDLNCVISPGMRSAWTVAILGIPLGVLVWHLWSLESVSLRPALRALYYGATEGGFMFVLLLACYSLVFYPLVRVRALRRQRIDVRGQIAVAQLLAATAHGDGSLDGAEQVRMVEVLVRHLQLDQLTALDLVTRAQDQYNDPTARKRLYDELNRFLTSAQKRNIVLMMLDVIAADGEKDAQEMHILNEAVNALGIPETRMSEIYAQYFQNRRQ